MTDFSLGEGDVLDLSALLVGAPADGDGDSLDAYLNFGVVNGDTVIEIDAQGDASGTDQTIVLQGVDLVTGASGDVEIINNLLAGANLDATV